MSARLALVALLSTACGGGAGALITLQGDFASTADAVTVSVLKTKMLGSRSFELDGGALTVGLSWGPTTRGEAVVVAQATSRDLVVASGWTKLELTADAKATVTLGPLASCRRTNCIKLSADCGAALDGCLGVLDCGACMQTEVCVQGDAGFHCGTGDCKPRACPPGACGLAEDGCGGIVDCGQC